MKKRLGWQDFVRPLAVMPFGFWGMYWFEHGFSWIIAIIGIVLFFVALPLLVVWWDQ
ncbi:hypothetical protein J4219_03840 [Candidatus Woesearchaeota archaeon]|nr:hypothetical protein [Candidatus Woesearchaeota archaeon]